METTLKGENGITNIGYNSELWERAAEVWAKINPEVCQELIESNPRRVQAVIKAKGGHTKY